MTDPIVNIRKALPSDLEAIVAVEQACFGSDRFSRRQFAYLLLQAKGIFYVAESDKHIIGYLSFLQRNGSTSGRIYSIAVHPDGRGNQTGRKLIDRGKEYARANGLRQISLEVRTDNSPAIRLYEKHGFSVKSVLKNYYTDGSDAFRMVTAL